MMLLLFPCSFLCSSLIQSTCFYILSSPALSLVDMFLQEKQVSGVCLWSWRKWMRFTVGGGLLYFLQGASLKERDAPGNLFIYLSHRCCVTHHLSCMVCHSYLCLHSLWYHFLRTYIHSSPSISISILESQFTLGMCQGAMMLAVYRPTLSAAKNGAGAKQVAVVWTGLSQWHHVTSHLMTVQCS